MSASIAAKKTKQAISSTRDQRFLDWCDAVAPWMRAAYAELGVREVPGTGRDHSNDRISGYLQSCWSTAAKSPGKYDLQDDTTAWCSAFVNWCLLCAGIKGTGDTWSQSWLRWKGGLQLGTDVLSAPVGSIVVMTRGNPTAQTGHVAFLWSTANGRPYYLGGNQGDGTLQNRRSDRVSICHYPNEVKQCIWPLRAIGEPPAAWSKGVIA